MATIYFGPDRIASNVEVEFSFWGVKRALAKVLTRTEYRRAYRGHSDKGTKMHIADGNGRSIALVATRNDDGSRGPTYTIFS